MEVGNPLLTKPNRSQIKQILSQNVVEKQFRIEYENITSNIYLSLFKKNMFIFIYVLSFIHL